MKIVECSGSLTSCAPFGYSRPVASKKETGEGHDAFEDRTWKERMHVNAEGMCIIVPMALKKCLSDVAQYLSESIPGKGKSKFTKHFKAGVMVTAPLVMNVKATDIVAERLFVPSDGRAGGGSRVWKTFPVVPEWQANFSLYLLDPIIQERPEKVLEYLEFAGQFIGMGRFRPINNGYYGRFKVSDFANQVVAEMAA